jgi:hypothetical protein
MDKEKGPHFDDRACSPSDGEKTPVGESAPVGGEQKLGKDVGSSPNNMNVPLPPVEEIFFPEGGFRAWSMVFGVRPCYPDRQSLSVTFKRFIVFSTDILHVSCF